MALEIECKIDKHVKIAGYKVAVEHTRNLYRDTGDFGQWNHPQLTIKVDDNLPEDLTIETKIHEIFHAVNDIYGLNLNHKQISMLSVAWHQLINDNNK